MYCSRYIKKCASFVKHKSLLDNLTWKVANSTQKSNINTAIRDTVEQSNRIRRRNYRFMFPEFLPDPDPLYRNPVRERLERTDMLKRRQVVEIPEFYVGSIVAVTLADPNAVKGGQSRFTGTEKGQHRQTGTNDTTVNLLDSRGARTSHLYVVCHV